MDACPQGVVYTSMGTMGILTRAELHSLAQAFARLPRCVLWKLGAADLPGATRQLCFTGVDSVQQYAI